MPINVIATDNFNRADGVLGSNWTDASAGGGFNIVTNVATASVAGSNTDNEAYWNGGTFENDQWSEATLDHGGVFNSSLAVGVRMSGTTGATLSGYIIEYRTNNAGECQIWNVSSGGVWTTLGATVGGIGTGAATIRLEVVGTTITGFRNGVQVIQRTDATHSSGRPGIGSYANLQADQGNIDNWSGGDWSVSSSYTDDFNRADGALGANWTTQDGGGLTIASNVVGNTTTGISQRSAWNTAVGDGTEAIWVEATISTVGDNADYPGITLSESSSSVADSYGCTYSNADNLLYLSRRIGGTSTDLATVGVAPVSGDIIRLEWFPNGDLFAYVNGLQVATVNDTNNAPQFAGMQSYYGSGTAPKLDNFEAGLLVGGYVVDQPTNSVRRKNAPASFGRTIPGGSVTWLGPQASVVLGFDFFDETIVVPPSGAVFKRWNGSAWVAATIKHGPGWPAITLNAI